MKKLSFKNLTSIITTLCLMALLFASCSSSDEEKDPVVVFTSLDANKTDAFIEEKILIELEGTGYTDASITSNNPAVIITKIAPTVFEISSTTAGSVYIYALLSNNTNQASKGVTLTFNEHGIKDFNTAEGIKVNVDKSSKVLSLFGEPDHKTTSTSGLSENWQYTKKGLSFTIEKSQNIVDFIYANSSNFYIILDNDVKVNYITYPYDLGNGWKINNSNTTMDAVINTLGVPYQKISKDGSTLRTYVFTNKKIQLSFYADTEDDYVEKTIRSIILY